MCGCGLCGLCGYGGLSAEMCPPGVPPRSAFPMQAQQQGQPGLPELPGLLLLNRRSGYQNTPTLLPPLFSFTSSLTPTPSPSPILHPMATQKIKIIFSHSPFFVPLQPSLLTSQKNTKGERRPRFGAAKGNRSASASSDFDRFVPGNRRHY